MSPLDEGTAKESTTTTTTTTPVVPTGRPRFSHSHELMIRDSPNGMDEDHEVEVRFRFLAIEQEAIGSHYLTRITYSLFVPVNIVSSSDQFSFVPDFTGGASSDSISI